MMSFLIASVKKDLARWRQDKTAFLIWLGIPFLIGGLITSMMDSGDGTPTGLLLIADQDESLMSGFIAGAYSQEQLGDLIVVEQVTVEEGEARINEGEASGFLTIPDGFQDAFLNETPVTLTLKTNPAQIILPGIIQDVTEILLDLGFYAQRLLGPEIQQIQNTDEAVRRSVQQVAERNNVPAERRNEAMERAFDEAAPRVRLQALEALVERARRDS